MYITEEKSVNLETDQSEQGKRGKMKKKLTVSVNSGKILKGFNICSIRLLGEKKNKCQQKKNWINKGWKTSKYGEIHKLTDSRSSKIPN